MLPRRRSARYLLSFVVPQRFTSIYGRERDGMIETERASWWQWRGRIWRHRSRLLDWPPCPVT